MMQLHSVVTFSQSKDILFTPQTLFFYLLALKFFGTEKCMEAGINSGQINT
jgi:hypothetical protein